MNISEEQRGIPDGERKRILAVTTLACILFASSMTMGDPDLWGHTLYGIRAHEQGVLVERTDPFSYTAQGAEWVNHEWLTEMAYGLLWTNFGNSGLVAWRAAWIAILFITIFRGLRWQNCSASAGVLILIFTVDAMADFLVFVRPQLATFPLFAITLLILRQEWESPSWRLWLVIPIVALWTNLHGGFLAGVAISGLFATAAIVVAVRDASHWARAQRMSLAGIGVLLATFATPYGWGLHIMLWEHLGTHQHVREWMPLIGTEQSPIYYVPFALAAFALLRSRSWTWLDFLLLLVIGWQAVSHIRHIALLAVAVALLLARALTDAVSKTFPMLEHEWSATSGRWHRRLGWAGTLLVLVGLRVYGSANLWKSGIPPWEIAFEVTGSNLGMPIRAVSWMEQNNLHGNILTDYGWGQFVIWHTFPDSKVGFDGRYRTIYPADVEEDLLEFQESSKTMKKTVAFLDSHPTEIVLLPLWLSPVKYMESRDDWREVYRNEQAAIFLRKSFRPDLRPHSDSLDEKTWTTFPGDRSAWQLRNSKDDVLGGRSFVDAPKHNLSSAMPVADTSPLRSEGSVQRVPFETSPESGIPSPSP